MLVKQNRPEMAESDHLDVVVARVLSGRCSRPSSVTALVFRSGTGHRVLPGTRNDRFIFHADGAFIDCAKRWAVTLMSGCTSMAPATSTASPTVTVMGRLPRVNLGPRE